MLYKARKGSCHYLTMATQLAQMYNLKLIINNNGTVEVRTYSEPVGIVAERIEDKELRKTVANDRKARASVYVKEYNPFDEVEEQMLDYDLMVLAEYKKQRSEQNSYKRTVQKIYEISRQCQWEYFITLTFAPDAVDRMDFDACMKKANKWFHNQRRKAEDLQYIFVPEEHEKGGWHIHGLVAQVGKMQFTDSGHKVKGQVVFNLDGWKYGFSTATKVTDAHRVSTYITKYITKDMCNVTKGKKRYYRSQNIPEPQEHEFFVQGNEKETYVQMLADSLGVQLQYRKDVSGYVDVSYRYFQKVEDSDNEQKSGKN